MQIPLDVCSCQRIFFFRTLSSRPRSPSIGSMFSSVFIVFPCSRAFGANGAGNDPGVVASGAPRRTHIPLIDGISTREVPENGMFYVRAGVQSAARLIQIEKLFFRTRRPGLFATSKWEKYLLDSPLTFPGKSKSWQLIFTQSRGGINQLTNRLSSAASSFYLLSPLLRNGLKRRRLILESHFNFSCRNCSPSLDLVRRREMWSFPSAPQSIRH